MRVLFRHWSYIGNVVPHDHVGNVEVRCGTVRQVTDYHADWLTSVFVNDDEIGYGIGSARVQQLLHLIITTIQPLCVGEYQTEFLK